MTNKQKENLKKIRKIARLVRKAFEVIAKTQGYHDNLGGLCGRAATQLFLECRRQGISIRLAATDGHAFCVYCGYIIDVTATQFTHENFWWPKIVIQPIPEGFRPWYHNPRVVYRSVCSAVKGTKKWGGLFGAGSYYREDRRVVKKYRR